MFKIDLTGQTFGKLKVIKFSRNDKNRNSMWECVCECEAIKNINGKSLRSGVTKSCGCGNIESIIQRNTKHGESNKSRLYHIWKNMRSRCKNKNNAAYQNYGGRGIQICDKWEEFKVFKEWAVTNGYTENLTIERKDNDKGYSPDNCRWTTYQEQNYTISVIQDIWLLTEKNSVLRR